MVEETLLQLSSSWALPLWAAAAWRGTWREALRWGQQFPLHLQGLYTWNVHGESHAGMEHSSLGMLGLWQTLLPPGCAVWHPQLCHGLCIAHRHNSACISSLRALWTHTEYSKQSRRKHCQVAFQEKVRLGERLSEPSLCCTSQKTPQFSAPTSHVSTDITDSKEKALGWCYRNMRNNSWLCQLHFSPGKNPCWAPPSLCPGTNNCRQGNEVEMETETFYISMTSESRSQSWQESNVFTHHLKISVSHSRCNERMGLLKHWLFLFTHSDQSKQSLLNIRPCDEESLMLN